MQSEDELNLSQDFIRIFPTSPEMFGRYEKLFVEHRYFNLLLAAWEQRYGNNRKSGRELLKKFALAKQNLNYNCES